MSKILKNPPSVMLLTVFVVALGLATSRRLSVGLFPPLDFPTLNLIAQEPDYSSLEMEQRVTLPLENAASGVLGVVRVHSNSGTGIAMVSVGFSWGTDMWKARELLQKAVDGARGQIPPGVDITLESLSTALSQIEGYSLQGGHDPVALRAMALYDLKPRLQRIPGVYQVNVLGGKSPEIQVMADPRRMIRYGITLDDLKGALADNNVVSSPGVVNAGDQELVLHGNGQYAGVSQVADTVVTVAQGRPVMVKDVARVTNGYVYTRGDTSEDGKPAVMIDVDKQLGYDTGTVARAVAAEIARFRAGLPPGMTLRNFYDQAKLVNDSIGSVLESVWIGGLLVVLVLALFLRDWKATVVATLSIPVSVVAALLMMEFFHVQLNIMSLGGLAIGSGMIVDATVVVLENIFRWMATPALCDGKSRMEVVTGACREVWVPVLMSTLANIGIFLPMVLVAGFAGKLFAPVSLTVTFALLASLVVSMTLIPVLANLWLGGVKEDEHGLLDKSYLGPLKWALKRPWWVLILSALPVFLCFWVAGRLNMGFLPSLDEGAVLVSTDMPPGTSLEEARRVNSKVEHWLDRMPGVVTVARNTGHAAGGEDTDNVNHSDIMVKLVPKNKRPMPLQQWINALSARTDAIPSLNVEYLMPLADKINDALGGVPADIGVNIYGPDLSVLQVLARRLQKALPAIPGLVNVHPAGGLPVPSLEVHVNRAEAGKLGIAEKDVYQALAAYTSGLTATELRKSLKRIPVTVRFGQPGAPLDLEALEHVPLKTASGAMVPVGQVASFRYSAMPSDIEHDHLVREVTLTGDIQGRAAPDVARDVTKAVENLRLPPGYTWNFSGKYASGQKALKNLLMVLAISIGVVSIILWFEFYDLVQVFLILLTIPLAAVGAIISLALAHQSLNVSSMIGAVLLVGIVVRNGIMLLDYVNIELRAGMPLKEAILEGSRKRVRPILMTAAVTMLGLLPLAVGWGTGSELQHPLAIAVTGGIFTSTLLTLVVLPAGAWLMMKDPNRKRSAS